MSRAATKGRQKQRPPIQHPQARAPERKSPGWLLLAFAAVGIAAALLAFALIRSGGGSAEKRSTGLPNTPDYHSLLVAPTDPDRLVLGTHVGLYGSHDGGRTWTAEGLSGQDAMNLARPQGKVVWAAGHSVLAKSVDGGRTWANVRPDGLPSLDVHGFAVDPRNPKMLWAAIAGEGLYRSRDAGGTFSSVSRDVGGAVMALAVTRDGRVLAGDMRQGLLESGDGGRTWRRTLEAGLMGLAINSRDPRRILATGPGILVSRNAGRTWDQALPIAEGAGPIAWAPSEPKIAYVVGFDKVLYKTTDGGDTWNQVS